MGSIPASRTKTEGPSVKLGPFSFKPGYFLKLRAQARLQNIAPKKYLQNTYKVSFSSIVGVLCGDVDLALNAPVTVFKYLPNIKY
ncbi:hypothetical protein GQ367_06485 [Polynucleobacter sp. MWH-CaK5]|uniref:hypothetical protein n=1 Tax=Polynucleobacter sp. MWH-CaK5 TaxID=2689107 RepID=UPI001BFE9928|nr:hypothetical protein [Polynucleobacter sp. MWH-CaK5]QWD88532.1 hypothetical protein GQ367_06485 [Polynucleobacter sp. MWH-CaK5]